MLKQLFVRPDRKRLRKRAKPTRSQREIGLEEALEFQERLIIEYEIIDVIDVHSSCIETVSHRVARETLVMPDAGKPLLLGGRNDLSVANQRRGAVMIEGRNAKYVH